MGLEPPAAQPQPIQIWVPPPRMRHRFTISRSFVRIPSSWVRIVFLLHCLQGGSIKFSELFIYKIHLLSLYDGVQIEIICRVACKAITHILMLKKSHALFIKFYRFFYLSNFIGNVSVRSDLLFQCLFGLRPRGHDKPCKRNTNPKSCVLM